jgi:polysaccharide biosynthesis/export protein
MDVQKNHGTFWLSVFFLFSLHACAPTRPPQVATQTSSQAPHAVPASTLGEGSDTAVRATTEQTDLERLAGLWWQRREQVIDYPIGPGDVIEISVPAMKELENRTIRVSGEGTVSLPFIGAIPAKDRTEEQLAEQLRERLDKYMYNPQVNVFVREYRSRQAAVIGAVQKPGLYNLTSGADTILDMLALAGGLSPNAAQRILFIPAEPLDGGKAKELASLFPVQLAGTAPSPLFLKKVDPIVIDLQFLSNGGEQIYLTMPARPGDVLLVPGAGDVLIDGWVEKPGAYKITPGLTVLAAVTAAGGPLFPADTNTVKVLRTEKDGVRTFLLADLEKIKNGQQEDPVIQEGDVIEVTSSTARMIPYALSRFFTTVFHIGGSIPIF